MEEITRICIGGMKFSEELVQVTVVSPSRGETAFDEVLHQLAGRQINIPFLCHSRKKTHTESCFCVLPDDLWRVREVLNSLVYAEGAVQILPEVGTLTIFPHRNSLRLLGLVCRTFADHNYPLLSLSTSISAIALNTRFRLLDEIAATLTKVVTLPENHAPFRQEFRLTQLAPSADSLETT